MAFQVKSGPDLGPDLGPSLEPVLCQEGHGARVVESSLDIDPTGCLNSTLALINAPDGQPEVNALLDCDPNPDNREGFGTAGGATIL